MGKRSEPDSSELAAAEQEDPGILADDSSEEEDFSSDDIGEAADSDVDEGLDADAESLSADEDAEVAADFTAGDASTAAAAGPNDSDLDKYGDVDSDNPSSSGGGSDSEREAGSSASEHDEADDAAADGSNKQQQRQQAASFLEGGKSASFAKAFAKIMAKPVKAAASASAKDVILSESAGLAKRKAEVEADDAAARQAKKQRQEMRKRGHYKIPRKGEDPAHDVREKQLLKLATRGVVLLFNAVNKAQKQKREAEAAGSKGLKGKAAAAANKAGFMAELKAKSAKVAVGTEQLVPAGPGAAAATAAAAVGKQNSLQDDQQQQRHGGAGWEVLGEGFPGLTGGVKMKDWDKAAVSDEEANGQELAGSDDSDSGGEGW